MADETEAKTRIPERRNRPRRHHRIGYGLGSSLALAVVLISLLFLSITGRAVPAPDWVTERAVASVNGRLGGGRLSLRDAAVAIGKDGQPVARLNGVTIFDAGGGRVATLNRLDAQLSLGALLQGRVSVDRLSLVGAQITVRRDAEGRFSLTGESDDVAMAAPARSLGDILETVDRVLASGPLAALGEVEVSGVVIALEDARSGRLWQATNAKMFVREQPNGVSLSVSSDVFNGTDSLAQIQISFAFDEGSRDTELGVRLRDLPAADIALQSPILAWLGVLDAPISGSVRATVRGDGRLSALDGTLEIAAGALRPVEGAPPVAFERANTYFTYDPDRNRLEFAEVGVVSDTISVVASGHTYIGAPDEGAASDFVGQFQIREASVNAGEFLEAPVSIDDLWADFRLRLDPFTVDIAQVVTRVGEVTARTTGQVGIRDNSWEVSVDASSSRIGRDEVMAFWPLRVGPKTRRWLSRNVVEGDLLNAEFGVRAVSGRKPDISLSFNFEDATIRFLPDMPEIEGGRGRAAINDRAFTIRLDEGHVIAADGGLIDGSGSVFRVPDTRQKPVRGELALIVEGPLTSALDVLDNPPLELMSRAGRPTDLAKASVRAMALVELPLKDGITKEDVSFEVSGFASEVVSDAIVPGRRLTSNALRFRATPDELTISGPGQLDGVPLDADWRLQIGDEAKDAPQASGRVNITNDGLNALGVALPDGFLSGQGEGRYQLYLARGKPPRLTVSSDLRGLGLSIPALGWTKAREAPGGLELALSLGERPDVETLELSAPGLALSGDVALTEEGALREIRLSQLRVGNWLDASARLAAGGQNGALGVSIDGGLLDLRFLPARSKAGGTNRRAGEAVSLSLDTVVVSDGIVLSPFVGQIAPSNGGIDGDFEARLSGRTLVQGALTPARGGTGLRVRAADAGGVLRDAGLTPNGRGGSLALVMTPVAGAAPGTYDGEFLIENMSLADAPVLAGLLNAISVVGLLDELGGNGIRFDTIDGAFRLTPERATLKRFAAVGPSLGISAAGVYDPVAKEMDMQGVVSPIYFVNSIGSLFSRRGEGLFGFNYRLSGPIDSPTASVNPLSILTPGMFRDIFRQPVPAE